MDLIIRISLENTNFVDWKLPAPYSASFQDVLYVISEASQEEVVVTAFEYLDEDSDRITVKTNNEFVAMVQFHISQMQYFAQSGKECNIPLIIYPKVSKPPEKRNKHGLKLSLNSTVSRPNHVKRLPQLVQAKQNNSLPENSNLSTQSDANHHISPAKRSVPSAGGDFEFLDTLGNGNSGVVYKAIHKRTGTMTAVKSIALDLSDEEQDRIKAELAILTRCNGSPHIVAFYGSYFDDNRVFLCMEYMDGGSLDNFSIIPENVLKRICHCVVQGLKYMWSLRIMHRDVKPSNMLVNTQGIVKLCDFGVSTQLVNSIARTYVGTNAYMAPERVVGHDYSIFSDIWSLGLSICEMATGEFPYPQLAKKMGGSHGLVPMELMQCIVNEAAPRLTSERFSSTLVDFIQLCLQKEDKKRPSPEHLCQHPFVKMDSIIKDKDEIIAQWVISNKKSKPT